MHYELLGDSCVGNLTEQEVLMICLTICSKVDLGGPLEVKPKTWT